MFKPRTIFCAALISCTVLLTSACTDHQQVKQDLVQAVAKQEQIQSYRYAGEAELKLDASLFSGSQPVTAALLGLVKESKFEYSGLVSLADPVRMEASVKLTPKGAASPIELPFLLKDNKMYLQMPAITKADEYLMLPLDKQADKLKNTGRLSASLIGKLLVGVNPNWLEPGSKDEKLADGEPAKRITLTVTDKNKQDTAKYFAAALPSVLNELMISGLSGTGQTEEWKKSLERIKIEAPTTLSILIDNQGFIREQTGKLYFSVEGGNDAKNSVEWTYKVQEINQTPAFTKEAPKQVKHAEDILRLLPKPQAGKK
ncbi:hypothetical protein [Paenibacillus elgii]|uniref:hypothetical protein n=1 Tax=Paenibacillus elgii TaxID=189691 RepID=UPI00203EDEC6|nr:hypothetical protein [Paenibacillus elgii]MCM3267318.1 hypothetical protein [Paenibacillus elgii]